MNEIKIEFKDINPQSFFDNGEAINKIKETFPKLKLVFRGSFVKAYGDKLELNHFKNKFNSLLDYFLKYNNISSNILEEVLNSDFKNYEFFEKSNNIITYGVKGNVIIAKTKNQIKIVESSNRYDMLFVVGPAGTGKTYTSVALAVKALKEKKIKRIILTRPAVEAGENLGFLPGDIKNKLDPYIQPLYDALYDMIPTEKLHSYLEKGIIQISPLAFMRGRTLNNAFVILDEAQNATHSQMKMFLTRMGPNAKFIITGDPGQIDLPKKIISGLNEAIKIFKKTDGIKILHLDEKDVIRHKLVRKIIAAYNWIEMNTLLSTNFELPKQVSKYVGKVREVISLENDLLVIITTDRLSAFDVVLPKGIPYKGQILNQISLNMLNYTKDLVPNWLLSSPDPNVSIGKKCQPFKVEMIIRGYLSGHAARQYKEGKRYISGVKMPDKMNENDPFEKPIITPSTKSESGHDEDISKEEILDKALVSEKDYKKIELYTKLLFKKGTKIAKDRGLILVDTKYEFGKSKDGEILLIDEIHTPDSSRYFYIEGYDERQKKRSNQKQLSKEFARQWLISHGFQGLNGQRLPEIDSNFTNMVSERYIELYEVITGKKFIPAQLKNIESRVKNNILNFLEGL